MRIVKTVCALAAVLMLGTAPTQKWHRSVGSFQITAVSGPLIAGSRVLVQAMGVHEPFSLSVMGPGKITGHVYTAPIVNRPQSVTLIGAAPGAVAYRTLTIVPPPSPQRALLAVASYNDGIALHDAHTFALIGFAGIGGAAGDVAFDSSGNVLAADTDGDTVTLFKRNPWTMERIKGVPEGNEIAVDWKSGNIFVSDRDAGPTGAVTRITPGGNVSLVATGNTAEGLTIDESRELVYVGNVNEPSVAIVDARTMRVVRKLPSVERTFGIALDPHRQRLFVVSNASPGMNSKGGYVAAIDASSKRGRIVRRSAYFTFPLGIAFDESRSRLFVTDEAKDRIYVLNSRTLEPQGAAIQTCGTPWRPHIAGKRLYVPCAQENRVDVFDLGTLGRIHGAPFTTGGFPLSVATWP